MTAGSIGVPQIIPLRPPKGCRRHLIDSNTEIELISESQDSLIYYTLNGKNPDPFQSYGEKYSFLYKDPFTLFPGKVTVKALAVSQDGSRQSFVVTRTFTVHKGVQRRRSETDQLQQQTSSLSLKFRQSLQLSSRESLTSELAGVLLDASPLPPSSPRRSTSVRHPQSPATIPVKPPAPPPSCVYCSTLRSKDFTDKHCTQCGAELPPLHPLQHQSNTTVSGRMAVCPGCRASLPPGTHRCIVCDKDIPSPEPIPRIRAQAATEVSSIVGGILCLDCGTTNPPHLTDCVTCGTPLHVLSGAVGSNPSPLPVENSTRTVMHPIVGSSYMMCGTCGRVNVSDARYCDWCGSRPEDADVLLSCHACSAANKWLARFCHNCGAMVKCPLRPHVELAPTLHMSETQVEPNRWIPVTDRVVPKDSKGITAKPSIRACGTQTQGLFYPSAKTISGKAQSVVWKQLARTASRDRIQQLPEFSPGKGLWRMQLEHICSHLKAHSQSSPDFQEEIGMSEIGKLLSAKLKEEEEGNGTLSLNLTFALRGISDSDVALGHSIHRRGSRRSISSSSIGGRRGSTVTTRKTAGMEGKLPCRSTSLMGIKVENHLLAAELGDDGQGRADIVRDLLEKGAEPNSTNQRGQSMLSLATINGHTDSITVLLNHGASLDTQDRRSGNTALHEAAVRGSSHKDSIELLLRRGANPSLKNKDGLTPFELVTKHHHHDLVKLFASHLGSSMLHGNDLTDS